jgi:hypothetical protein
MASQFHLPPGAYDEATLSTLNQVFKDSGLAFRPTILSANGKRMTRQKLRWRGA